MIKYFKDKVQVRFGKGDICIVRGWDLEEEGKTAGVGFMNQDPRPIGLDNRDSPKDIESVQELPVTLIFSNVESIDVMIYSLNQIKEFLLNDKDV